MAFMVCYGVPFGVLVTDTPPELITPIAEAASTALECTWQRGLLTGVIDGLNEWVNILAEGSERPIRAKVHHIPPDSMREEEVVEGEAYRMPLSKTYGALAITLHTVGDGGGGGGSGPSLLNENIQRGLDSTVPLLKPMLKRVGPTCDWSACSTI